MNIKKLPLLLLLVLGFVNITCGQDQTLKSAILKGTGEIPLPTEDLMSIFLTVGLQPEIVGTMKVPVEVEMSGIAMIASTLDKGKLLLIGSDMYLKTNLLKEKSIQQLLINAINLSALNASKTLIAVTTNADKGLLEFLNSKNMSVYTTTDFQVKKGTKALFLTEDVTDELKLKNLESFIRKGGILVFGSPYQSLNYINKAIPGAPEPFLKLNSLFAKAGVINQNLLGTPGSKYLITTDTDRYLHINTMLEGMTALTEKTKKDEYIDYFLRNPTLEMAFRYNDVKSPVIHFIHDYFGLSDTIPIASPSQPIFLKTEKERMKMRMAYQLYNLEQDFAKHPDATFPGYESFPGKIAEHAKRVSEEVTIAVKVGTQGLSDPSSVFLRPHSTGLYIPAGERVKIILPDNYLSQNLTAQIGVHNDDVTKLDELTRPGIDLTTIFKLDKTMNEVFSPFGGLLLIGISDTTSLKTVKIQVSGAVKAPLFILGKTSEAEWNDTIKNYPAPLGRTSNRQYCTHSSILSY